MTKPKSDHKIRDFHVYLDEKLADMVQAVAER